MPDGKPYLALALGGGAAWCIAQIGVLQVLEENGVQVDAVAGTSGGSLVGALFADGTRTPEAIAELAGNARVLDFVSPTVPLTGFFDSDKIGDFMRKHLESDLIEEMRIPFAAVAVDLASGDVETIMNGPIPEAVQASCSIPIIFTPTKHRGKTLIDGGLESAVPVNTARKKLGAQKVVAVNVMHNCNPNPNLSGMPGIAFHIATQYLKKKASAEAETADVAINVNVEGIDPYELNKHKELIRRGRDAAEGVVDKIKALSNE